MDNNQNEHNHQEHKEITIIVNTREKVWSEEKISYEQVIILAFGSYSDDPNVVYSVTYAKGTQSHHEGSLVKGRSVEVKEGMIFNVTKSDKS